MAPLPLVIPDCPEVVAPDTPGPVVGNTTEVADKGVDQDDLSALLYIVVTLLFYSMGIVVGIITYLKRERADIEEEMQIFDMYLTMKRDPFNAHRLERVQQMARRLHKMEQDKANRLNREHQTSGGGAAAAAVDSNNESGSSDSESHSCRRDCARDNKKSCKHVRISDCVPKRSPSMRRDSSGTEGEGTVLFPFVLSTANMLVGSTTARAPVLHVPSSVERPPAPVNRPVEHERRGALPMGASALHVVRDPRECRDSSGSPETARLISGPTMVCDEPSQVLRSESDDSL